MRRQHNSTTLQLVVHFHCTFGSGELQFTVSQYMKQETNSEFSCVQNKCFYPEFSFAFVVFNDFFNFTVLM